jgi:hypothetical protein
MSSNVKNLREACWDQFKNSYNKFNSIFSNAVFKYGSVSIHAPEFLKGMGLEPNIIVTESPAKFVCRCMDERCQQLGVHDEELEEANVVDLAIPGMGALLTLAELSKHAEVILRKAKENNIKIVELYSHEGCGAAALARPKFELITGRKNATSREVEEFFGQRAYEIFDQVNIDENYGIEISEPKYQTVEEGMLKLRDCNGCYTKCPDIHPALGIVINSLINLDFNSSRASVHDLLLKSELPFFLITDYGEEFDDHSINDKSRFKSTAREVELASNIISGEHGMGDNFNLPIIFLVNSRESKLRARKLIELISKQLIQTKFSNTLQNPVHHHFMMIDFMEN